MLRRAQNQGGFLKKGNRHLDEIKNENRFKLLEKERRRRI